MNSRNNDALRLRKARLWLNLSQRELATLIGISPNSVYRYENEQRTVSHKVKLWVNSIFRKHHLNSVVIKSAKDASMCHFQTTHCYTINDDDRIVHRKAYNPCFNVFALSYVYQYVGQQGLHHFFKEVHGGWSRTFTNAQLVDKRVQEVPYYSAMAG